MLRGDVDLVFGRQRVSGIFWRGTAGKPLKEGSALHLPAVLGVVEGLHGGGELAGHKRGSSPEQQERQC